MSKVQSSTSSAVDSVVVEPRRSAAQIESEIEATRNRLASRLDDFQDYVKPANVVDRGVNSAKGVFVDEYGGVRPERVAIAAGAVVGLIALRVLARRRRR
jgi:ElaB/YqjD/DUF883 family membrane-anchored ribosome-binding protein